MKCRLLKLSTGMIVDFLKEDTGPWAGTLPADAQPVGAAAGIGNGGIGILIKSDSFDPTPDGTPVPQVTPKWADRS